MPPRKVIIFLLESGLGFQSEILRIGKRTFLRSLFCFAVNCNCPESLPDDIQADFCAGIASQDFQDKLKTSIQKANALLLTNTHTNENNARIPQEEKIESQTNLTIGSTYDIPVFTNSSKTTARSDTHINDIYQTFERQLDGIPIEGFSTIESNESTTSIAEITKSLHILNSTSDRPKRRGRRPGAAAFRA